ncbi:hypothetical protein T484DRAFT_1753822 [Baffinella frigidus]|nr:hypothetical protein T484DRAFT_1753822 [Cryptophyta sp. CCMP2293]
MPASQTSWTNAMHDTNNTTEMSAHCSTDEITETSKDAQWRTADDSHWCTNTFSQAQHYFNATLHISVETEDIPSALSMMGAQKEVAASLAAAAAKSVDRRKKSARFYSAWMWQQHSTQKESVYWYKRHILKIDAKIAQLTARRNKLAVSVSVAVTQASKASNVSPGIIHKTMRKHTQQTTTTGAMALPSPSLSTTTTTTPSSGTQQPDDENYRYRNAVKNPLKRRNCIVFM